MTQSPPNPFGAQLSADGLVDLALQSYQRGATPTPADVYGLIDTLLALPLCAHLLPLRDSIANEILRRITTIIGHARTLEDNDSHLEWLPNADRAPWRLWPRLHEYLRKREQLPLPVLDELDSSTDQTLGHLESPARLDPWDRRGLVVGHVQSGKTTHYTSLAAKAIDSGYQVVIVLAGVHNSLRSQTHERFDKHLIGRDSAALLEAARKGEALSGAALLGVGQHSAERGDPDLPFTILTCTTSADDGDFRKAIASQVNFTVGPGTRLVMVIKKNATILRQLCQWLRNMRPGTGSDTRISAPTLVIDDEADHASVNTKDPELEPATINRLIRELLTAFDHVGFVGYTATPFANIFIPPDTSDAADYGPDLFPRAFIVNLHAPSDYIGPDVVFGHPGDESIGLPERLPLPMYSEVGDAEPWLPDRHNKLSVPGPLPESLLAALRVFVLACCARTARSHSSFHSSMLIHATRFVNVQARVAEQISAALSRDRSLLESGTEASISAIEASYKALWQTQIVAPHAQFKDRLGDACLPLPLWEEVWTHALPALRRIKTLQVNGSSSDVLGYTRNPEGRWVVAIGGDKLSRGLTLEGLTVSYFLRTSNMFDTLMQMGRWFGYRPHYADLCRVYTTPFLYRAFREIALAMEELRADFDRMADARMTPLQFGLRVRTPSDRLLITAANKIRSGQEVQVRFAGELIQALELPSVGDQAERNEASVRKLLDALGRPERTIRNRPSSHFVWRTGSSAILECLENYEAYKTAGFVGHCESVRRYISDRVQDGELTEWTVVVVSQSQRTDLHPVRLAGADIPRIKRSRQDHIPPEHFATQAVVGSREEALDLSPEEMGEVERRLATHPDPADLEASLRSREVYRSVRPATRGLLLIYPIHTGLTLETSGFVPSIAISFPYSQRAKPLSYTVAETWRQQNGLVEEPNADAN